VVLRYRSYLESRQLAPGTINLRLGAVRRLAYEAADCGLLSSLNGLLTGAAGQINGTTPSGHNVERVGVGTGTYALGAPRQVEFGLRLTF
jgi:hypothetical protein